MALFWTVFSPIYVFMNFCLSVWIYSKLRKFYTKKQIISEGDTPQVIDVHQKYKMFCKTDSISFLRIFLGLNILFWPKIILIMFNLSLFSMFLSLFSLCGQGNNASLNGCTVKFFSTIVCFLCGFRRNLIRVEAEDVYTKYFGRDSKITYDQDYSLLVSNHTGWVDIICYMNNYRCGFISKDEVENYPLVGNIAKQIHCLFVQRDNAENRQLIVYLLLTQLDQIGHRQKQFLAKEENKPLLVFPEGTVTNGKYVLKLKKGAFNSLMPVKPIVINTRLSDSFHLSLGTSDVTLHVITTLCYLYHNINILELPVMTPNDFMFSNYTAHHPEVTEKWEIYAEVTREIMCLFGNMEPSDATLRDNRDYYNILVGKKQSEKKENDKLKYINKLQIIRKQ